MCDVESEQQRFEEGKLGRDFISMMPNAIAIRALIDTIGVTYPQPDLSESETVENMSVDGAA